MEDQTTTEWAVGQAARKVAAATKKAASSAKENVAKEVPEALKKR